MNLILSPALTCRGQYHQIYVHLEGEGLYGITLSPDPRTVSPARPVQTSCSILDRYIP